MNRTSKRGMSVLLLLVMLLTTLPASFVSALAAEAEKKEIYGGVDLGEQLRSINDVAVGSGEDETPGVGPSYTVQVVAKREDGSFGGGSILGDATLATVDGMCEILYEADAGYKVKQVSVLDNSTGAQRNVEGFGVGSCAISGIESNVSVIVTFEKQQLVNAVGINGQATVAQDAQDAGSYHVAYTSEDAERYVFEKAERILDDGTREILSDATAEGLMLTGVTDLVNIIGTFEQTEVEYKVVAYRPKLASEGGE